MPTKQTDKKSLLVMISIFVFVVLVLVAYGFYEKNRKIKLYQDFKSNKLLLCGDTQVQRAKGWRIHNNKFFTNGTIMKTIIFCKSVD